MAEGFITRKGGVVTEQALAPTITEVSVDLTEIVFTITNNDASTAVIVWEVDDATPDENSIELAGDATSSNITVTGLTQGTEYTVSATASVTGKVLSNVASLAIETDEIIYTAATGGATEEYDSGGKRYKSHTFTSNGTFEVTTVGDATDNRNQVDYLIIGGGGGGSAYNNGTNWGGGGGGGAGGYQTTLGTSGGNSSAKSKVTVTAQSYTVTIGAGGGPATNGSDSSAIGITSLGGGASQNQNVGLNGGSGGGGGGGASNITYIGGDGAAGQGFDGGDGGADTASGGGGGGGGAGGNVGIFLEVLVFLTH